MIDMPKRRCDRCQKDLAIKDAKQIVLDFNGDEEIGHLVARSIVCVPCSEVIYRNDLANAKGGGNA